MQENELVVVAGLGDPLGEVVVKARMPADGRDDGLAAFGGQPLPGELRDNLVAEGVPSVCGGRDEHGQHDGEQAGYQRHGPQYTPAPIR